MTGSAASLFAGGVFKVVEITHYYYYFNLIYVNHKQLIDEELYRSQVQQ